MKKIQTLSGVLALAVLLLFPLATWAQTFGGGSGTEPDPYIIKTKEHFNELVTSVQGGNDYAGKYFLQAANIDLGGATIKPFELNATYLGGYYTLGNFKLEIPEDATEVVLFNMLAAVTLDKITVIQPKDEEKKDKKLEKLTKFRFAFFASSVAFRNVNAELDFGSRKTALLNFLFSENTGNVVFENCKISAKVEFADKLAGDVKIQFAGSISDFVLLNGDLDVEVVKGADFTGNVTLSASLVGAVYDAVLVGKRVVNVTGTGTGTVDQTGSDAAVTTVSHWLLYAKEAYSDVNKVCADAGTQASCSGLTDANLKMDVAAASTTKVNGSLIYGSFAAMPRFQKGQYPAPRWYRETARYQRALPLMLKNTPDTPFEIETPVDFIIAAEYMEELQFIKQTANLDFAAYGESIMYPKVAAGKTLEYDGGGYKISGFGYNLTKESALSAFALFTDGKIRNVVLEGAKVVVALDGATKGNYACLALAPDVLSNCTLNNCELTINNTGSSSGVNAALLAASMAEKGGEKCTDVAINNSKLTLNGNDLYGNFAAGFATLKAQTVRGLLANNITINFNGEAEAQPIALGGLVGSSEKAKIAKSGVSGTIKTAKKASQMSVGGFVGMITDESKIEKCYAKVSLDTDKVACLGGFAGVSSVDNFTISDSYVNTPKFRNAGGDIAGFMGKTEVDNSRTAFQNCYTRIASWEANTGVSPNTRPFATYPAGVADPSDLNDFLKNCYFNIVSGYPYEDDYKEITAKKNTNMSYPSTFTDWDFDDTWMIAGEAPNLQWEPLVPWKPEGDGSEKNPYLIATLNNLRWVSENTDIWEEGLYYKQIADIDATESETWNKKDDKFQGFRPIGNNTHPFSGQYDGGEKIIKNLFIGYDIENVGFFGYVNKTGATDVVLNKIRLENLKIKTGDAAKNIGGLVGKTNANDANISECHVLLDSIVAGTGAQNVGGFVGYADNTATFQIASAIAAHDKSAIVVKAGTVGGFAGQMESNNGTMQKLYTNLNVVEPEGGNVATMGGFVGAINGGLTTVLQNANSLGDVNFRTAAALVGAFVGDVDGSARIQAIYTAGKVQDISGAEPELKTDVGFGGNFASGWLRQNYYQKKQGDREITSPSFDAPNKCTALEKAKLQSGNADDMLGFSTVDWKFEAGKYPELLGMEPPKMGTVTVNKTGEENGTISVTIGGTEVTSGSSYTVGTVITIKVTLNDPANYVATVTANDVPLALTHGEATYVVTEGVNAIKVVIAEGKKATVIVKKVGEGKGTIAVTIDGTEVTSGNQYFVGAVVKINVTLNDPANYVATVTANDVPLALTHGEATYVVTKGNNALEVIITEGKKATVIVKKVGEDKGTIAVTIDGTEVMSGNLYVAGSLVKINVTLNDPANYVAMVTANGVPLALTHGEATYVVTEGVNAIKVVIAEGKKATVIVKKVGEGKGTIAVTIDGTEVTSGNQYFVGAVVKINVTLNDPANYVATVTANDVPLALTHGEATYVVTKGNNALEVIITEGKKATVIVKKVGEDKGTIAVTIDGTEVMSGNLYAVGAVVKIKVTLNDPANSVAMVTANDVPLALTHGEATYAVVEGDNTIKVVIAEGKKTTVTVEKVGEDKGTIAVTVDGAEVISGNQYFVGVVISFKVTVSDPAKYEAKVFANGKGIKLTNGEGTYAIVEGNNAIKVVIATKSTPTPPPSAVEDIVFANVVVAPNPFGNQLRIASYELRGEYALYNAQGVMVASGVLEGSETHINTSSFPAGMYLLRLRVENGATKTYSVVKQ